MGSDDKKIEIILESDEATRLLKILADGLKHAVLPGALNGFAAHIESCTKLEFSLKQQGGLAEMKLKVKGLGGQAPSADGKPRAESYKTIKKRLKTSFKFLQHSLGNFLLPPAEIVDGFLQDSLAMCSHPARGEQDYGPHLKLCNELKTAFDQKDRASMELILAELDAAKKTCHAAAK
ncbi:MAG: GAK system XXXCH domain-containing protein [Humidesulfovibrio sp.]|nr:GAK system XXXCH domain-containing protein [Humidesulfovibrio sp.]